MIFGAAGQKLDGFEEAGKLTSVQKPILGALTSVTNKLVDVAEEKTMKAEKKPVAEGSTNTKSKLGAIKLQAPPPMKDPVMKQSTTTYVKQPLQKIKGTY